MENKMNEIMKSVYLSSAISKKKEQQRLPLLWTTVQFCSLCRPFVELFQTTSDRQKLNQLYILTSMTAGLLWRAAADHKRQKASSYLYARSRAFRRHVKYDLIQWLLLGIKDFDRELRRQDESLLVCDRQYKHHTS